MQIPAESVTMMPDAVGLLRDYKRGGKAAVLAARVSGEAKSAFPDGTPARDQGRRRQGQGGKARPPPRPRTRKPAAAG